uniref:Sphingomyelin synthase-like domain-containing protein n=1 Tax=Pyrodinium bahamense TaxID=73915 RepID=A0A7R9ZVG3_9DINO|mmetsp:Transcript_11357/g.30992  ORF Transcript_11357/g.30992 Transcript_11357/m.30992 type:complete len:684 (+) Transcript_11357:90-2141(+)
MPVQEGQRVPGPGMASAPGGSSAGPGSSGQWVYSRVPPGDSQSSMSGDAPRAAEAADPAPLPAGKFPWFAPAALLFGAIFLQNAGLYNATCVYVRWMDELGEAQRHPHGDTHADAAEAVALEDPLAELLGGWRLPPVPDVPWRPEAWAEVLTALVSVLWLGWVVRLQDLRLWTKVMLSGAVLATLKGLLAWATVLPDAAGWRGCRARLGEDGVAYFRHVAAGGGGFQSVQDITVLSISSLGRMGRLGRQRVCADTIFSTPTCFSVLLSMGVYDLARTSTEGLEAVRQSTVRSITGLALGMVLAVNLVLTLLSPQHYTLDVAIAYPVTLLVYTNPVIAVTARRWVDEWAAAVWSMVVTTPQWPPSPSERFMPAPEESADPTEASIRDLGEATVPPCCLPFCSFGGLYHLRDQPGIPGLRPWTEECERRHQHQLAELRELRERDAARRRTLKADIDREKKEAADREAEVRQRYEDLFREEELRLEERLRVQLAEANERLDSARRAARDAESEAAAAEERASGAGHVFVMLREQLQGQARSLQLQVASAREGCERQKQEEEALRKEAGELQEVLRLAGHVLGADPAGKEAEGEAIEAGLAFPEPVKDVEASAKPEIEGEEPATIVPALPGAVETADSALELAGEAATRPPAEEQAAADGELAAAGEVAEPGEDSGGQHKGTAQPAG